MNEFRLSYGRIGFTFGLAAATLANPLAQGPAINIGTPASQVTGFGSRTGYPQGRFHNTYQIQDTVSWSHDKHSIRAGFDLPVIQVRDLLATNSLGTLNYAGVGTKYSALADYVDDFAGSGGSITQVFGNPIARPVFYYQNYFVQDNWNITANLHLELGLRYEYSGTPFNNVPFPAVTADSVSNFTAAVSEQADTADWGPRFGFAYTPAFLGEKKTVIRGGFGIFYDGLFTQFEDNMMASAPNAAAPDKTSTASASQPRGTAALSSLFSTLNQRPAATDFAEYITPQMASPRMLQWNLNLERELPGLFTAQIGYVGTRGEHLFATTEFNPYVNDTTGSYARIFNTRGRIVREDNTGDSIYHALQTSLVRKYRNGLLFRAAYTFSRAEDDTSEIFSEGLYSTFATAQFPSARKTTDYGLSAFDHRQRLVFSYVYAIPKWSEVPRSVSEVVNGWQLSGVTQFQSGSPANVVIGYDWNGDGILNDRPEVGNPKAPLASFAIKGDDPIQGFGLTAGTYCDGPSWLYTSNPCVQVPLNSVHWVLPYFGTRGNPVGRNNVILRGFEQWDFSAQKSFKTCKEQSFDFRAEMFDVFNHGDTGTPNLEIWNGFADPTNPSTGTSFGNYTTTVSGHRSIRMLLRYSF
jgi:hypothetical protein